MAYLADCLNTVVKNTSGEDRTFTCLPGAPTIDDNEEFTIAGDLFSILGGFGGSRARAKMAALEQALDSGDLEIVSRPAPILANDAGNPKAILVTGTTTIGTDDPYTPDSES